MTDENGNIVGTVDYKSFGDEKPYFPGRDASFPDQSSLESANDIVIEEYNDPKDDGNIYFPDDPVTDYGFTEFYVGGKLKGYNWNLILLDARETSGDGINQGAQSINLQVNDAPDLMIAETSEWKFDYMGVSVKDPVTYTGKQQDDPTGLYYFSARYYDPNLGRFISEDQRPMQNVSHLPQFFDEKDWGLDLSLSNKKLGLSRRFQKSLKAYQNRLYEEETWVFYVAVTCAEHAVNIMYGGRDRQ
ncbi:MAG: hypothetical protein KAX49_17555 [Halanaerobiales bacterium]|nr:hypothetical protein [Halanaerobiales bacterium]